MSLPATAYDNDSSLSDAQLRTIEAALHTLSQHLPEVNTLLDTSFSSISDQFMQVANLLAEYGALAEKENATDADKAHRAQVFSSMTALVTKTIVDMQFQDRVSQNLVITINIAKQIAELLQERLTHGTKLDTKMTQQLVYLLNLGEIKEKFIAYAQSTDAMEDPAEYGIRDAHVTAKDDEDDIELF